MDRWRAGIVATALLAGGSLAIGLVDCASPTQIVVEVYSDACEGSGKPQAIHQTGIAVGKADSIDDKPPTALHDGCEKPATGGVGTLTIYPSGANDEEVAIKVVAGVDTTPDRCVAPGYAGCIAHRRVMKFIPNTSQHAIVRLSLACLNRTCPIGTTCDNGVCKKEEDVLADGGTRPNADVQEAGVTPDGGAPDAAIDPCIGCKGQCAGGTCTVDCGAVSCLGPDNLCAPTLPCTIKCSNTGQCPDIHCTTTDKCTVDCGTKKSSCGKVTCNARECDVTCQGNGSCEGDGGILLDAGVKGSLTCAGDNACQYASCNAQTCEMSCNPSSGPKYACPDAGSRPCTPTSDCTTWTNPVPGN